MDQAEEAEGPPNPTMPRPETPRGRDALPDWALERARSDLFDVDDDDAVLLRAGEILREAQQIDEERHDEYDDPDSGGEA
ncbi:MAG TPA: hypothetical protein VHO29_04740 [Marmoricola sp.]|nr:hypothetical protein [Marmoricola sp.]